MTSYRDLTVVIPTLNEEKNIGELVSVLVGLYPDVSVFVVDDGSADKTQAIVRKLSLKNKRVKLIDRRNKNIHGLTVSVVEGVMAATTAYFVVIDGDFQHPPEKIEEMYHAMKSGFGIAVGTRMKVKSDWPLHRRVISRTALSLGRMRLRMKGISCRDVVSGFFGSRTELFQETVENFGSRFEMEGYKVLFDFLKYVVPKVEIAEIGYTFGARERGTSKIRMKHMVSYFRSLFR